MPVRYVPDSFLPFHVSIISQRLQKRHNLYNSATIPIKKDCRLSHSG